MKKAVTALNFISIKRRLRMQDNGASLGTPQLFVCTSESRETRVFGREIFVSWGDPMVYRSGPGRPYGRVAGVDFRG